MNTRRLTISVGVLLAVVGEFSAAEDCPERVGRAPQGVTQAVLADGALAFVGNGAALEVVDLAIPASPVLIGSLEFDSHIRSLALDTTRVYVGTLHGFHVIDVGTPSAPVELGALALFGFKSAIGASGTTACIVEGSEVIVVDVSDPAAPMVVGSWSGSYSDDVVVAGRYAYVMADGLKVLDLDDPTDPTHVGQYAVAAESLDLAGDVVYVAGNSVTALSVADPTNPSFVGTAALPPGGSASDIAVHGDHAYVSTSFDGLHVFDVDDPQLPAWIGTAPPPGDRPNERWDAVAAIEDHAIVGTIDHGIRIVDATDPADPTETAVVDAPGWTLSGSVSGGILVTANYERGIRTVDVSDPATPEELAVLDLGWWVEAVDADGSLAVAVGLSFAVVDISDPSDPLVVGETPMWEVQGMAVELVGDLAYIADPVTGLRILDISDPTDPTEVGALDFMGDFWEYLDVEGALLVLQGSTIEVIDVANPLAPARLSTINQPTGRRGVALRGSALFTVFGGWLRTFDLSDPASPVEVNADLAARNLTTIGVSGSVAYLGSSEGDIEYTVEVWNIGDPTDPTAMGVHPGTGIVHDFAFGGGHVFTARMFSGVDVFEHCQGPLFADGFESGDATMWSVTVP
jgi:hypothetical protein